jgi:hypothetical protein
MKKDALDELRQLLNSYGDRLSESERRAAAHKEAHEMFPARFLELKAKTIQPVLTEFVDELQKEGHYASVRDLEEGHRDGAFASASITLRIVPKPYASKASEAGGSSIETVFSANRAEQKVVVSCNNTVFATGGSRGKRCEYDLATVTADVVAEQVLLTLKEAFGAKAP